jgi:hypothetical protein
MYDIATQDFPLAFKATIKPDGTRVLIFSATEFNLMSKLHRQDFESKIDEAKSHGWNVQVTLFSDTQEVIVLAKPPEVPAT